MEYHIAIAECSGNSVILSQILSIQNLTKRMSKTGMKNIKEVKKIYEEHLGIYLAVKDKNSDEAREAMRNHMENSFYRYEIKIDQE